MKVMVKEIADTLEDILAKRSQGNEADRSYLVEDVRNAAQVRVLLNLCCCRALRRRCLRISTPSPSTLPPSHLSSRTPNASCCAESRAPP